MLNIYSTIGCRYCSTSSPGADWSLLRYHGVRLRVRMNKALTFSLIGISNPRLAEIPPIPVPLTNNPTCCAANYTDYLRSRPENYIEFRDGGLDNPACGGASTHIDLINGVVGTGLFK